MKILYGITKSNFGGAQRYVFDVATEMKKLDHDVTVLCGQGKLVEQLNMAKVRVITIRSLERDISLFKDIKSFVDIVKILKHEKPDVFHINSSKMGGIGGVAGRLAGVEKIIFTAHGWAFNEQRSGWQKILIKFFVWLTILLSDKTICVSEETRKQIATLPLIKNKLMVIRNGIREFALLPKTPRTSLIVGTIGELHRIKGFDILLFAWSKFIKKHEANLIIIGDGEEREKLVNMAKNLGISGSVIFRGYVDNARSMLSGFDIYCMTSRSEALPYSLLEAGLAELPVIATLVGGIPEIIESGVNGVLVPVEDAEVLHSTLILLAEDATLRSRLGMSLKKSIQENFSFERMVRDTLSLYEI